MKTEEERKEYEESLKTYRDIKNVVDTAKAEGKAEGKVEGKAEGKLEKEEEVIEKCMEENMEVQMISKIVSLPILEVKKIIEKIKKAKESEQ
ncbi:MAG: hypothetical protein AAF849_24785 [Bacteroidota bacterium]